MKSILIAAGALGLFASSFADVAYSDLDSSNSYGTYYTGWYVGYYQPADEFVSAVSGTTSTIEVPIGDYPDAGSDIPISLSLWTDNGGYLGTEIGSWSGFNTNGASYYGVGVQTLSTPGATLVAGDTYWLELTSTDDGFTGLWDFNNYGIEGNYDEFGGPYGYYYQAAFQVNTGASTSSTPSPAAVLPFLAGLVARRRNRKA